MIIFSLCIFLFPQRFTFLLFLFLFFFAGFFLASILEPLFLCLDNFDYLLILLLPLLCCYA